jgi:hypothetical protein
LSNGDGQLATYKTWFSSISKNITKSDWETLQRVYIYWYSDVHEKKTNNLLTYYLPENKNITVSNLLTSLDIKLTIWPVVVCPIALLLNRSAWKKNHNIYFIQAIQKLQRIYKINSGVIPRTYTKHNFFFLHDMLVYMYMVLATKMLELYRNKFLSKIKKNSKL